MFDVKHAIVCLLVENGECCNISKFNYIDTNTEMLQHVKISYSNIGNFSMS